MLKKLNKISASEAGIDVSAMSANALKVVSELQKAGYQAYLVGGCARDLLLGMKPKDFDVATDATPEQTKRIFRNGRIIGRRFKIVHVRFGYEVIEVATFRASAEDRDSVASNEMSEGDQGQLLRDNVYGSIEEDVVRRDFRVNALYYDPIADVILDYLGGLEDIRERKLVSIGAPEQRFREDPVRMLRVVRFAAKLDFSMEDEALKMIEEEGKLLSHVSSARLFEEVLKLFHGGAAYETYLMLRKYGLFKYLFPFTDQCVINDVEGMPERALKNTDKRIHQGKPVIPAFLFACMMWDPVKADAQILMEDGASESEAWRVAMGDGLRDQNQYVAVPRRLAEIILDIWNIHFRLIKANPRMVKASLNNRRFRAAYDFLLLRTALHEVDEEIGQWWTDIQEVEDSEREEMIAELGEKYKSQGNAQHADGEANGNSVNYTEKSGGAGANKNRAGSGKKTGGRKKSTSQRRSTEQSRSDGTRSRGRGRGRGKTQSKSRSTSNNGETNGNAIGNELGNESGNGGSAPAKRARGGRGQKKRGTQGKSQRGRGRKAETASSGGRRADSNYSDARPKDDLGTYQVAGSDNDSEQKKVKVRRKKRIPEAQSDSDTDNTPHF